jgi:hypothetical protein
MVNFPQQYLYCFINAWFQSCLISAGKTLENRRFCSATVTGSPHAYSQPFNPTGTKRCGQRLQAFVARIAAAPLQLYLTQYQIHFIMDNQAAG